MAWEEKDERKAFLAFLSHCTPKTSFQQKGLIFDRSVFVETNSVTYPKVGSLTMCAQKGEFSCVNSKDVYVPRVRV